ncbi:hypothetical protein P3T76_014668 [Phytophthora citrophthora]|uniref:BZIP domain-containing protein n=1 Tax=Phytophthora citrophthora TaxID=4793 RepID=A0AAD9G0T6_9STRA|nr:hypothetical protein P3T76_014668 [Phytophthora citrophthora]
MVNNSDEVAFLSEISALLDTCDPPVPSEVTLQEATVAAGPDNLLLASHQLVAETEALLSSCNGLKTSGDRTVQVSGGKTQADRRKIRNANAAKRRLKYCKKVEDERQLLRQQEKELSTELIKLQAAKSETQLIFERTKTMPIWRAIATRQLQSRIVAETERRRLRDAVATSTKVLQELE